jgi:hypothetical protein
VLKTLDNQQREKDILSVIDERNFKRKLRGGAGRGQLTKVGEQQMFNLGRRLKNRYVEELDFLSKYYSPMEF